ncbi:MAG TPA: efflux RND transporter permease subunit [Candidatus Polarisedimenticolaceae bacterium]|nr:efflux RND transporter permease subunit [Candidatus Polarisedimenticolaceae bacterium]
MNPSELFIRRPVTTTLVMLAILVFGTMAYRLLPVSDLPTVDFPTLQVSAGLPGASPETMASSVATPLEREFSTIAGLDSMSSNSGQGTTSITLQFALDRDIDAAAQDVQSAIARATRQLPPDMPSPPSYQKVNPAERPVLYMALTSPTLPLYTLNEYGETLVAQRISTVSGVAQVEVLGAQKYAVRVQLDPQALASRGIGLDEVTRAIQNANVNLPTGTLYGPHTAYTVEADGQLTRAAGYRPIVVAYRNGQPVRLEELGQISDGVENDKTAGWFNQERAVILAVQRQPGTNTVAVVQAVRRLLPQIEATLPASVSLAVTNDRSESIRDSVNDVKVTLAITLVLVVLVIFLFLRNVSSTVIPSLALPMSLVGTFAVMYLLGYSLDNLSLMALTLSVGFVVDDAIVVLENIVRHMELGKPPFAAAIDGSREIGFTVVSMTVSLAAVFIPILFMGGILGRLFNEFAVTIGVAVLISGFVSLSLTPMLASRFLRPHGAQTHGRLYQASERAFQASLRFYDAGLSWSLRHRGAILWMTAAVMGATVWLFLAIPKGFIPDTDTGQIFAVTEAAEGTSFESLVAHQRQLAAIVAQNPNVQQFMSNVGSRGGMSGSNSGTLFLRLKPKPERRDDVNEVIRQLRAALAPVPGMRVFLQNPPAIRLGGRLTKSQYQLTLQSADTEGLYRVAPLLEAELRKLPELRDVTTDLLLKNPQIALAIDRDKAATVGVSAEQIEETLFSAYGARQVSTIYAATNTYKVILELAPAFQADPAALSQLYVRSSGGRLVPLEAVASLSRTVGPLSVSHSGQLPSVTVSFDLAPGYALGQAVSAVQRVSRQVLPPTMSTSFQGTAQVFQSSLQGLGLLLVLAVLVIYMVLGVLYESFIHPLTILSALPFAGFGALLTLLAFRTELSLFAFVGVIMLVGLVKKNGIMMVDFAVEAQRREGKDAFAAIHDACLVRFRPIMMTTMAALFGTLPIALGWGAGAEARRPLGLAVVGGLLFSQTLTLYVTPVVYTYMDGWQRRLSRRVRVPVGSVPQPTHGA